MMMTRGTGIATTILVVALFVETDHGGLRSNAVFFQEGTLHGADPMFSSFHIGRFQQNLVILQTKMTMK